MMIRYIGPHQSVEIAATGQDATRLQPLEVDDTVAKRLLKQSTWESPQADKDKE